jgi:FHS family L-fucose permease-like MFS transporter
LSTIAEGSVAGEPEDARSESADTRSESLLGHGQLLLFVALILCFTAWGIAADLTTPMVAGFKRIFDMSTFQASLVQLAYFGAYFLLALPAAFLNRRFGYKVGILTGLGLAAIGAFLFYPASKIMTYEAFLVALFAIAAGCSILETSANPYVLSLGPERTATRRLNLAQAFNPVGTNIGVLVAATLILPRLADPVDVGSLSAAQLHTIRAGELGAVMAPYLGLGFLLLMIAVAIASQKAPPIVEEFPDSDEDAGEMGSIGRTLWRNRRYRFGVVAQFCNVAAQVCTWTYLIQYVGQALGGSLERGGFYLQISLLVFLASRFVMTWVIGRVRATKVLAVLAFLAVALCLFAMSSPNMAGVIALVAVSFCLSLMFPTIYGVALKGLGPATKFGAAGLVMAIVGGAIMPLVQGALVDSTSPAFSFIVPACLFVVVGLYALYDLRAAPNPTGGEPAPDLGPARPGRPAPAGGAA